VHIAGTFRFAAQKWPPELNMKNLVRLSQAKLLVGFQSNYRSDQYHLLLFTWPARSASLHKMAARAKNRKI
jgi:hypothetical protein